MYQPVLSHNVVVAGCTRERYDPIVQLELHINS